MVEAGTKTVRRGRLDLQGIGFIVSVGENETAESEFAQLVTALYDWYSHYGVGCAELTLAFVAGEEEQEEIVGYCLGLVENEHGLRPLFLQLEEVSVYLVSPGGTEPREFKIMVNEKEK